MNRAEQAFETAKKLAEEIHALSADNFASFSAVGKPSETSLLELRQGITALVGVLRQGVVASEKQRIMDQVEGTLQTAYVTSLLSERQLQDYLGRLDDIRELTNQEE